MIKKKAQGWGFDVIISVVIFSIGIMGFFLYSLNYNTSSEEILPLMNYDADIVSSFILSQGYPVDWTETNVVSLGLTTDNKINDTKLERLYNLNRTDYEKTRRLFSTKYQYFFNFSEGMYVNGNLVDGIGAKPINQKDLIRITRFTIYKDRPVSLNVYIWK